MAGGLEQEAGTETLRHVEAAIESFDLVLDLSTGAQPLVEATVRRLHELATSAQDESQVLVPLADGLVWQAVPLPKGTYKAHPNHVREADGTFFAYAPVDRVGDEMHRLMGEVRSTSFAEAHPAVQAAYSHHALVRIHPFADGNGRVARLVASVFLLPRVSGNS